MTDDEIERLSEKAAGAAMWQAQAEDLARQLERAQRTWCMKANKRGMLCSLQPDHDDACYFVGRGDP